MFFLIPHHCDRINVMTIVIKPLDQYSDWLPPCLFVFFFMIHCRLKKKEFSLEEIYTNKNFNKPPERWGPHHSDSRDMNTASQFRKVITQKIKIQRCLSALWPQPQELINFIYPGLKSVASFGFFLISNLRANHFISFLSFYYLFVSSKLL